MNQIRSIRTEDTLGDDDFDQSTSFKRIKQVVNEETKQEKQLVIPTKILDPITESHQHQITEETPITADVALLTPKQVRNKWEAVGYSKDSAIQKYDASSTAEGKRNSKVTRSKTCPFTIKREVKNKDIRI